ncbi:MAG: hypothetical protein JO326_09740, partial [Acetobacteraceae bacterium]|nr:hypothetical protein [Acetobacteraceae bacterium]
MNGLALAEAAALPIPAPGAASAASKRSDADDLARLAKECAMAGVARHVLWVRVSSLPPTLTRPHHRRLLHGALSPLLDADRARSYRMPNGDVAVAWRGDAGRALTRASADMATLLADATPRVKFASFFRLMRLPEDTAALQQAITASMRALKALPVPVPVPAGPPLRPLDLPAVAGLEAALGTVDLSSFICRQPVLGRGAEGHFEPRWEERSISVPDLLGTLAPDR